VLVLAIGKVLLMRQKADRKLNYNN